MTQYEFGLYDECFTLLDKVDEGIKNRLNVLPNREIAKTIRQEKKYARKLRKCVEMELERFVEEITRGKGKQHDRVEK